MAFSHATKFQKTMFSIILGFRANKEDLDRLKIAFKMFDKNRDGVISLEEIREAQDHLKAYGVGFNIEDWKKVYKEVDLDGDGQIDFNEFFTAAVDHKKVLTDQDFDNVFKTFDVNGDGKIDIAEFRNLLPSVR